MENNNKQFKLCLIVLATLFFQGLSAKAQYGSGIIMDPPYVQIQQSSTETATITGTNLSMAVIGISGTGVYGIISEKDPSGQRIKLRFTAKSYAELGERELSVRDSNNNVSKFIIKVVQSGAPYVDSVFPNSGSPGDPFFVKIFGMGFTSGTLVTTSSDLFHIGSFASTSDGSVLVLSISIDEGIAPGDHQIFISNAGGQAQADFTITSATKVNNNEAFNADPYSPGIYATRVNPTNQNQIIIEGSMFDPDPYKNTVTLLEDYAKTIIGREVDIAFSSDNQIIINLPDNINADALSLAVTNQQGTSNFKDINFDTSPMNTDDAQISNEESITTEDTTNSNDEITSEGELTEQTLEDAPLETAEVETLEAPTEEITQDIAEPIDLQEPIANSENTYVETVAHNLSDTTISNTAPTLEITEDANTIQTISQYLFSTSTPEQGENPTSLDEIKDKDPEQLLSTIEENKKIKNQLELIKSTLDQVKEDNKELSTEIKKIDKLKVKVSELQRLLQEERQKHKPDRSKLAKYEKLLASASAESRSQTFALLNKLLKYKPQLKNLLTQKPLDLAAVQPNIPDDSVVVQYIPTEEGIIILLVDKENIKTRINKNVSRDILNSQIQAYRKLNEQEIEKVQLTGRATPITSWSNDKSKTYKKKILPLKEKSVFLYNALIAPIEKDIKDKKVIAVVSNGWLRYLPFQSLAKRTPDGNLRFLISDKSIVYLDSVVALSKATSNKLNNKANITVFANPDGTLSGANKEAEIITMLFSKTTKSLVKQPFNVPLINQLAKNADILHLATHGHLDGNDINSSYLVAGKKKLGKHTVSQKVYLQDLYDLNLRNSKLIVLSGCDTGKIGNLSDEPDDIVGSLATAFRVAGANSILASLWKAHDEATRITMKSFYENIKNGFDKAEALRRAQLTVKQNPKYSHPIFWAMFNLIGDWR